MKSTVSNNSMEIIRKIVTIEKEIADLKLSILKNLTPTGKRVVSLKGILEGVDISDEDISSAKKSLLSKIGI